MAARYKVTMMLKGSVNTGRSHLLKMEPRALERMGLVAEAQEMLFKKALALTLDQAGAGALRAPLGKSPSLHLIGSELQFPGLFLPVPWHCGKVMPRLYLKRGTFRGGVWRQRVTELPWKVTQLRVQAGGEGKLGE